MPIVVLPMQTTCLSQCMTFYVLVFAHYKGSNFNMLAKRKQKAMDIYAFVLSSICVLDAVDSITQSQSLSHSEDTTLASKIEAFYWDSLVQGSC